MTIPPWVFWALVSGPFISGFGMGVWTTQFVTRKALKAKMLECQAGMAEKFLIVTGERKEIWDKIDKMYDILLKGGD